MMPLIHAPSATKIAAIKISNMMRQRDEYATKSFIARQPSVMMTISAIGRKPTSGGTLRPTYQLPLLEGTAGTKIPQPYPRLLLLKQLRESLNSLSSPTGHPALDPRTLPLSPAGKNPPLVTAPALR